MFAGPLIQRRVVSRQVGIMGLNRGGFVAPATDYANTGGTGNRTAIITVTSSLAAAGGTLSNAVDGGFANNTTDSYWFAGGTAVLNNWLKFDFGVGAAKYIDEFKHIQSDASAHGNWKAQISNDDSAWTDVSASTALGGATTTTITCAPLELFRYFRILGVSGTTSATHFIQENEFKISA
jgi:hypothetical protein